MARDEERFDDEHELDDDFDPDAPAPVVTDEGVYGTLPRRRRAYEEYQHEERPLRETWTRVAAVVLAVSGALWLVLFSASQATGASVARPSIEALLETMTGLDGLLALHEDAIRASEATRVPGFPIEQVELPADVRAEGRDAWRASLLEQSSALIYEEGPDVMAPDGNAGGGGVFSTAGGVQRLMGVFSESTHGLVSALVWPVGLVAVVAAVAVLALGSAFGRFQALGIALAVAGAPSVAGGLLGLGVVAFIGSDGSALANRANEIGGEIAGIPLWNGLTFLVAGIALALAARVTASVAGRFETAERATE